MTTLAERKARAQSGKDLPREVVTLTFLSGEAVYAKIAELKNKRIDLSASGVRLTQQIEAEKDDPKPRKGADKNTPAARKAAVDAEIAELTAEIDRAEAEDLQGHQADALLVGMTSGAWQRWRDEHPARVTGYKEIVRKAPDGSEVVEQGDPIYHPDDLDLTKMPWSSAPSCNAAEVDALLDDMLIEVDGEPAKGAWSDWLSDAVLWQNRRSLIMRVVGCHEAPMVRLPKAVSTPPTPSDSQSSDSPEPSESHVSDS